MGCRDVSEVEILNVVKKILGKYEKYEGIKTFFGDNKVVCLSPDNCVTIYNPSLELSWTAEGYLEEVKITGKDKEGKTRSFKRTLTWTPEGYLQTVSEWVEV